MSSLSALGQQRAREIRAGSLIEPPGCSQIERAAHGALAEMNALGFITDDSQGGRDKTQKAYVKGYMLDDARLERVLWGVQHDGFVGWRAQGVTDNPVVWAPIPVTFDPSGPDVRPRTNLHLYMDRASASTERELAGLGNAQGAVMVCFMDARRGRPAWHANGLFTAVLRHLRLGGRAV